MRDPLKSRTCNDVDNSLYLIKFKKSNDKKKTKTNTQAMTNLCRMDSNSRNRID